MIVVSDNQGDYVEVGDTREQLEQFLDETCSSDYAQTILLWFDGGAIEPLLINNGLEEVVDTWEIFGEEDAEDVEAVEEESETVSS